MCGTTPSVRSSLEQAGVKARTSKSVYTGMKPCGTFSSGRAERESVVAFVQRWSLGRRETSCRGKEATVRIITDNMIKRKRESKQREWILELLEGGGAEKALLSEKRTLCESDKAIPEPSGISSTERKGKCPFKSLT